MKRFLGVLSIVAALLAVTASYAGFSGGFGGAGLSSASSGSAPPATPAYVYAFEGIDTTSSGLTTVTYPAKTFTAGRYLIAISQAGASGNANSVNVNNGLTATGTFIARTGNALSGAITAEFWEFTISGSGTADLVVTWANLTYGSTVIAGKISSVGTFANSVAQASASITVSPYAPTASLTVPTGGLAVIGFVSSSDFSPNPVFNYGTRAQNSVNTRPVQLAVGSATASGIPSFSGESGNAGGIVAISFNATGASASTTLDPAKTGAGVALSNANLTMTRSSGAGVSQSVASHSSGLYYFEMNVGAGFSSYDHAVGIGNASQSLSAGPGSPDLNSVGYYSGDAAIYANNVSALNTGVTYANGDVIGVAADLTNKTIWIRKNGGLWNGSGTANPATNTGGASFNVGSIATGPWFAMGYVAGAASLANTMNFGPSYANSPPSGFSNW